MKVAAFLTIFTIIHAFITYQMLETNMLARLSPTIIDRISEIFTVILMMPIVFPYLSLTGGSIGLFAKYDLIVLNSLIWAMGVFYCFKFLKALINSKRRGPAA